MKRSIDIVASVLLIASVLPVFSVVGLAVLLCMGRPILFRQLRSGLEERPFWILKFRTMVNDGDSEDPSSDHLRLTRLGRFLRVTSLDELPQLWNVLRGEMSLVGPRPQLLKYLDRFTPEQRRRHQVLPGITGWAQVNGRNAVGWERRLAMDVWYVDHQSLWLDLRILLRTVPAVLSAANAAAPSRPRRQGRLDWQDATRRDSLWP